MFVQGPTYLEVAFVVILQPLLIVLLFILSTSPQQLCKTMSHMYSGGVGFLVSHCYYISVPNIQAT